MKNVTIALDDETHRAARIRAAEMGTSLSALVKDYLQGLVADQPQVGVREMAMSFAAQPAMLSPMGDKSPLPGALLGNWIADDFDETPKWLIDAFEGIDSHLPWPE
jgi:plasmid stability protein